jgi:hypothetical protein
MWWLVYTALARAKQRAVIVVNGGLANRQTGAIYRCALMVAVANDRIARRCGGLAEQLVSASEARRLNPATERSITTATADSEQAPTSCLLGGVSCTFEVSCTFARRFGIR